MRSSDIKVFNRSEDRGIILDPAIRFENWMFSAYRWKERKELKNIKTLNCYKLRYKIVNIYVIGLFIGSRC